MSELTEDAPRVGFGQVLGGVKQYQSYPIPEAGVILASGPSVGGLDLSNLMPNQVIAINRAWSLYPMHRWFVSRALFSPQVIRPNIISLYKTHFNLFDFVPFLGEYTNFPRGHVIPTLGREGFSFDLEKGWYPGYSSAYCALQVAVYLGFKKIYLLGCDCCEIGNSVHFYDKRSYPEWYFERWQRTFNQAKLLLKQNRPDIEVYNCSLKSHLEAFPKINYEDIKF